MIGYDKIVLPKVIAEISDSCNIAKNWSNLAKTSRAQTLMQVVNRSDLASLFIQLYLEVKPK